MKKYYVIIAILFVMTVFVSPVSASAATKAGVKSGSFFYFFDKAFEKTNLFFTFSAEKKAKKALEYADERLAEAEESASENKPEAVSEAMENYQENISLAEMEAKAIKDEAKTKTLLSTIASSTSKHQEILEKVLEKVPEKAKQAIKKAIETSKKGQEETMKEILEIKQGFKEVKDKSKKTVYNIDKSKVLVTGKRTQSFTGPNLSSELSQVITLSAILKNNAEVGIPSVKINKITIFDDKNNIVAVKQNYNNDVSIPYQGEFPFSFILLLNKSEAPDGIKASNFDIDYEIPPFSLNEKVVRLGVTNQKTISIKTDGPDGSGNFNYSFTYKVLLSNNSDKEVSNIRRISFLKSNGETLTKIGDACCTSVRFEIKPEGSVLSLDAKKYIEVLKPHEQREYEFEIKPMLYNKVINTDSVELVSYFIGSTLLIAQERKPH